jgi:hypothetical protein
VTTFAKVGALMSKIVKTVNVEGMPYTVIEVPGYLYAAADATGNRLHSIGTKKDRLGLNGHDTISRAAAYIRNYHRYITKVGVKDR